MKQSDTYSAAMLSVDLDSAGDAPEAEVRTGAGPEPAGSDHADAEPIAPDGDEVGYRGTTAYSVAGISYRQLDYWARTGLVVPSVRDASGSGTLGTTKPVRAQ